MLLESDSSWLTLAGPYPMLPRLSAPVSGVDCPCPFFHANFCCSPLSSLAATAFSWVASSTLIRVPLPLPDTARFHVQESFVWFRAKTDSSALAAYPHSATRVPQGSILSVIVFNLKINNITSASILKLMTSSMSMTSVSTFDLNTRDSSAWLQQCIQKIYQWVNTDGFRTSKSRTRCMHFCQ